MTNGSFDKEYCVETLLKQSGAGLYELIAPSALQASAAANLASRNGWAVYDCLVKGSTFDLDELKEFAQAENKPNLYIANMQSALILPFALLSCVFQFEAFKDLAPTVLFSITEEAREGLTATAEEFSSGLTDDENRFFATQLEDILTAPSIQGNPYPAEVTTLQNMVDEYFQMNFTEAANLADAFLSQYANSDSADYVRLFSYAHRFRTGLDVTDDVDETIDALSKNMNTSSRKNLMAAFALKSEIYSQINKQTEALRTDFRLSSLCEEFYGYDSLPAAQAYYLIGCDYMNLDQPGSALENNLKALDTLDRLLGRNNYMSAYFALVAGKIFSSLQQSENAVVYYKNALDRHDRLKQRTEERRDEILTPLSQEMIRLGNFSEAERLTDICVAIKRKIFGSRDASLAECLMQLSYIRLKLDRTAEVGSLVDEALKIFAYSATPAELSEQYLTAADMFCEAGEWKKSIQLAEKAMALAERAAGKYSLQAANSYYILAENYRHIDAKETIRYDELAVAAFRKLFDSEDINLAMIYGKISDDYADAGDYARSVEYLEAMIPPILKNYGDNYPGLIQIYQMISDYSTRSGNRKKAAFADKKLRELI